MPMIAQLAALEILDSRGRPTVQATCTLTSGATATVSVPSGASTGSAEAHELRDGDAQRYHGLGCRTAVANIVGPIQQAIAGKALATQRELDGTLIALDGTPTKGRLGANAILAVSLAFARAVAVERGVPLYTHFADLLTVDNGQWTVDMPPSTVHRLPAPALPRLTINLFSGGKHAGGQVPIQDVLVVPVAARTIDEGLATVYAVYQAAAALCAENYGTRALTADEGGLAPPFASAEAMLDDAVAAITRAGFAPGSEVALAVDVASSQFFHNQRYQLGADSLDSVDMIDRLATWAARYPIISLEDGLAEDDWDNWPALQSRLGSQVLILGDDLLCTNPARIRRAIETKAANALLLKVNQIGTLTEAADAYRLARAANWHVTVSARSGETEDNWLADLAVGWAGDDIKIGSITQSERLAKYNRLLVIEAETSRSGRA